MKIIKIDVPDSQTGTDGRTEGWSLFNSVLAACRGGIHLVYCSNVQMNAVILKSQLFQLMEYSHFCSKHLNDLAEVVYIVS